MRLESAFELGKLTELTGWTEPGMLVEKMVLWLLRWKQLYRGPAATPDVILDENWVERTKVRGYAAIRTENLYASYLLERTGRLDNYEFWRELLSTEGAFDRRPCVLTEAPEEENHRQRTVCKHEYGLPERFSHRIGGLAAHPCSMWGQARGL